MSWTAIWEGVKTAGAKWMEEEAVGTFLQAAQQELTRPKEGGSSGRSVQLGGKFSIGVEVPKGAAATQAIPSRQGTTAEMYSARWSSVLKRARYDASQTLAASPKTITSKIRKKDTT